MSSGSDNLSSLLTLYQRVTHNNTIMQYRMINEFNNRNRSIEQTISTMIHDELNSIRRLQELGRQHATNNDDPAGSTLNSVNSVNSINSNSELRNGFTHNNVNNNSTLQNSNSELRNGFIHNNVNNNSNLQNSNNEPLIDLIQDNLDNQRMNNNSNLQNSNRNVNSPINNITSRIPNFENNNDQLYNRILNNMRNENGGNYTQRQNGWNYNSNNRNRFTNRHLTSVFENIDDLLNTSFTDLLEPVVIRPTEQQIETATRRTSYSDVIRPVNSRCPITLNEFSDNSEVVMIIHCGHLFSPNELINWFRHNVRCPICRYDIRNYNNIRHINTNIQSNISNSEILNSNNQDIVNDENDDNDDDDDSENSHDIMEEGSESGEESVEEIMDDIQLTHELYNDLYQNTREELP